MIWSHNDLWMLTADHSGFVKYWQSNMNNVKMYQAHRDPVRGLRCDISRLTTAAAVCRTDTISSATLDIQACLWCRIVTTHCVITVWFCNTIQMCGCLLYWRVMVAMCSSLQVLSNLLILGLMSGDSVAFETSFILSCYWKVCSIKCAWPVNKTRALFSRAIKTAI